MSTKKLSQENFINKSINVHGKKYDYFKVVYINMRTKILIGCEIHKYFYQSARHHLVSQRCPKCAPQKQLLTNDKLCGISYHDLNIIDTIIKRELQL